MTILLFPGRHLLNTSFQASYLRSVLQMPLSALDFLDGSQPTAAEPIDQIVFAVTSSNQQHSRYNPIPFHVRAIGVDRFARSLEQAFPFRYRIVGVPHFAPTPRFAEFILKEIAEQSEGELSLTPQNGVVLCSTPAVFEQFQALGFAILPAEYGAGEPPPLTPTALLRQIVDAGEQWMVSPPIRRHLHAATFDLWSDFPDVPRRVLRLWRDPLLNKEGSLTATRDYASYAFGMGHGDIIQLKYADIRDLIVPGKIVDEGCADGALLVCVAEDFPDSDLIGIEITGEFMARCQERQRAGQFGNTFVHFHQRNITQPVFEDDSIDTTLCNSTVHELYSYGDGAGSVHRYFADKFRQTRLGGRLIIRDVVGPENKEQQVYLLLAQDDGSNEEIFATFDTPQALAEHLSGLSTHARFRRFARDFRGNGAGRAFDDGRSAFPYHELSVDGACYAVLSLRHAVEFMSKMDYVDNWESEMHEEFAFWSFSEWKAALTASGFRVLENPNAPNLGSRVYTNDWIVANRWQGRVALFHDDGGRLQPLPFPPTNIVLVGEK